MKNEWFWNNRLMLWFEKTLLRFTNWFWNKRHPPVSRTQQQQSKPTVKKQKKSQWSAK